MEARRDESGNEWIDAERHTALEELAEQAQALKMGYGVNSQFTVVYDA